jgi:hypothetical protein
MKIFISFVLMSLSYFTHFGVKALFKNNEYIPADYVVMAQKIRDDLEKKLSKRHNMEMTSFSGGLANCVNSLGLGFKIQAPLDKDEIRRILIDCVEEFLSAINSNEKLRPFLKNYPFTSNEIRISISIVDKTGKVIFDPEISIAIASQGKLRYTTSQKKTMILLLKLSKERIKLAPCAKTGMPCFS